MIAFAEQQALPGINIVGHLRSSSGLGNTARLFCSVLQNAGYPLAGLDVDYGSGGEDHGQLDFPVVDSADKLPYENNLVISSLMSLSSLWLRKHPHLLDERFRNAGLVFWELPQIPAGWRPALALFDTILTCSPFVRHALETAVPDVPTLHAEHPLLRDFVPRARGETRRAFGIPEGAFVCATSLDLRSDIARKNPFGAINAFQLAFPADADVRLLIKTGPLSTSPSEYHAQALAAASADSRIVFVSQLLPYAEVVSLYAAADVFVALHRSEGLGLGPLEAMSVGVPAIATAYSGNMSYMTEANSLPVPYRLIRPNQVSWQYRCDFAGENSRWAEPDLAAAADAMQLMRTDRSLRIRIGERARRDVQERQESAWQAPYAPLMLRQLGESGRPSQRPGLLRSLRMQQFADPVLRRQNLRSLAQKLFSHGSPGSAHEPPPSEAIVLGKKIP